LVEVHDSDPERNTRESIDATSLRKARRAARRRVPERAKQLERSARRESSSSSRFCPSRRASTRREHELSSRGFAGRFSRSDQMVPGFPRFAARTRARTGLRDDGPADI